MAYTLVLSRQALKDRKKLQKSPHVAKARKLLDIIRNDPFQTSPPFEKLIGVEHVYSRRINIQHRLVYEVLEEQQTIKILRLWTHYE